MTKNYRPISDNPGLWKPFVRMMKIQLQGLIKIKHKPWEEILFGDSPRFVGIKRTNSDKDQEIIVTLLEG